MSILEALRSFSSTTFLVGLMLMLGGTLFQNVGLGLQKLVHVRELALPTHTQVSFYRNIKWWSAFGFFLCGVAMDFAALAFLPTSLAMPIGSVGLPVSSMFAAK
jgi:hypothetical protein